MRRACGAGIAQEFKDVQAGGAYFGMSWPIAHAAFIAHTAAVLSGPLPAVCVLGIDETRSNAKSKGYNHLAMHQGRNAFDFRNTDNQRRRIRWACTRQHRRATAKITEMPG